MRIHIEIDAKAASEAARAHLERALNHRLHSYSPCIRSLSARVIDTNGPRGGVGMVCRIEIRLIPTGRIMIEEADSDLYAAAEGASRRAAKSVARAIGRARDFERDIPASLKARHSSTLLDSDE